MFTYQVVECPETYYPNSPSRLVSRFLATQDSAQVGYADYFVDNNCSFGIKLWVEPEFRNAGVAEEILRQLFTQVVVTPSAFWLGVGGTTDKMCDVMAAEFPHITMYISGENPRILNKKQ